MVVLAVQHEIIKERVPSVRQACTTISLASSNTEGDGQIYSLRTSSLEVAVGFDGA